MLNLLKSKLWSSIPFWNSSVQNEGGIANLAKKISSHGNVPQTIEKWSLYLWSATSFLPLVKISALDHGITRLQGIILKIRNKLSEAKHIAHLAGMWLTNSV